MDAKGFEDYIIRSIVDTVDYDAEKDAYIVNNVSLTDDVIIRIVQEAKRYGIDEVTARQTITQLALSIKGDAAVSIEQGSVHIKDIKQGQIFILCFRDERYGRLRIELMSLNTCGYYLVLGSDIVGLQFEDVLKSRNGQWNHGFAIDFNISRNRKAFPESNTYISISKFEAIEYCNPTHIHKVLDESVEKSSSSKVSVYDIVELTALFVNQNFSKEDYDMLLKDTVCSGLSSFHLNIMILRAKEAVTSEEKENRSKEYFHANISSFEQICQVPIIKIQEKKVVEIKKVVEKEPIKITKNEWSRNTWGLFLFLFLCLIGVLWELGVLHGRNIHLSKENVALADSTSNYKNNLMHVQELLSTPLFTFPSWKSTNHKNGTVSRMEYTFYICKGDTLSFRYAVSSEISCDYLRVSVEGHGNKKIILHKSGERVKGSYSYIFGFTGRCILSMDYVKDYSINKGLDEAEVSDICVYASEKHKLELIRQYIGN